MITEGILNVGVEELVPEMIVLDDVTRKGVVLLKKGCVIDQEIINRLNRISFMDKIKVSLSREAIAENEKEAEIKKVQQELQEVTDKLQVMFTKMNLLNENNIGDLREFACKIEEQLINIQPTLGAVFKGYGDDCIYKHGVNVAVFSALLGKWSGFEQEKIRLLIYAALLHDYGIIKLPEELQKQADLITNKKNRKVREHVKIAYNAIKSFKYLNKAVTYGVLMHHERCDGSGYPLGLESENIHDFAKIIAIADEFDVCNSNKEIMDSYGALYSLRMIKEMSLKSLDYKYSKIFLEHIASFYTGEEVVLSNGDIAKVLQINIENLDNPLLLRSDEFIDLRMNKDIFVKELVIK